MKKILLTLVGIGLSVVFFIVTSVKEKFEHVDKVIEKRDKNLEPSFKVDSITIDSNTNNDDDPCKELFHRADYSNGFHVMSSYRLCEPDWKMNLKFYKSDLLIYEITDLREYHFDSTSLYFSIDEGNNTFKILIERDDRPLRNQMDVFTFQNNALIQLDTIPIFELKGDFDNDGIVEYGGRLDTVEAISQDSTTYNPYLIYEISETFLRLDTLQTVLVNQKIYGDFYGYKSDDNIQIHRDKVTFP